MGEILNGQLSRRHFLLHPIVAFAVPGFILGVQQQPAGEILIGEYGPLTGATAPFGISTKNGIDLAVDAANKAGGVLGKRVRIIVEDDKGKADEAQRVVTKLITQDNVIAVLGEVSSSNTLAAASIAQRNRIPMISPSATNARVTQVGDYIFRGCFLDPFHGSAMAKFAAGTLKARKAAILRDSSSDYSVGLANAFSESFKNMGGSVSVDESYSARDKEFTVQLSRIKSANPDVIYVPGYYAEAGLIAIQAKGLGLTASMLGGDGWDSPKLISIGGDSLNGSYYSNHYSIDSAGPENQNFVAKYRESYRQDPDVLAAMAFDSANLLFDAIRRANSTDPSMIRTALAETKDFQGITGPMTLDKDRNAVKPAVILQVKDGKIAFVETVAP